MANKAMTEAGGAAGFSQLDIMWRDTSFHYLLCFNDAGRGEYDYRAADIGANGYDGGKGQGIVSGRRCRR